MLREGNERTACRSSVHHLPSRRVEQLTRTREAGRTNVKLRLPTKNRRPGLRAGVLLLSAVLVAGTAVAVSLNVSDHLARAATDEAVGSAEAVVRSEEHTSDLQSRPHLV